jgi:hypothetical protein
VISFCLSALLSKPLKLFDGKGTIPAILEWSNEWFKSVSLRGEKQATNLHLTTCVISKKGFVHGGAKNATMS